MSLFERVASRNKKESLVENGDRIVVGFSGGPDSVFLVEMLLKLREKIDFDIVLVHINHLLRGEEAQRDEDFSINYGKSKGLKVFARKINITSLGKEKGLSLEEAGREARYSFYKEVLEKTNGNKIALAHNKDDQIETFMFRLTRGTGLSGLEGIATKRDRYIRPISEIYKSEIVNYLDSIRIDLIPFIEKRYNPKFKDKIFSLIEEIRDINIFIEKEIEQFSYNETINIESILKFPKSIRGKILSTYLYKYGLEVNRKKISLIESILEKGGSQEISLDSQYILKKEYNILKIQKINLIKNNIEEVTFTIPNKIKYGDYIIEAEYVERGEQNKNCFYTNLKLGDTLIVRGRKDGDKIIPTGMKGEKKLKEIFINEKIGKEKRDSIPLIVHNGNIVWIAGVRGNEKYNSTEKRCIKLSVRRTK